METNLAYIAPDNTIRPYSAGWTCSQCGGFVPNGVTHACWSTLPNHLPRPVASPALVLSDDDVERIAKRVVELLREGKDT